LRKLIENLELICITNQIGSIESWKILSRRKNLRQSDMAALVN